MFPQSGLSGWTPQYGLAILCEHHDHIFWVPLVSVDIGIGFRRSVNRNTELPKSVVHQGVTTCSDTQPHHPHTHHVVVTKQSGQPEKKSRFRFRGICRSVFPVSLLIVTGDVTTAGSGSHHCRHTDTHTHTQSHSWAAATGRY